MLVYQRVYPYKIPLNPYKIPLNPLKSHFLDMFGAYLLHEQFGAARHIGTSHCHVPGGASQTGDGPG